MLTYIKGLLNDIGVQNVTVQLEKEEYTESNMCNY